MIKLQKSTFLHESDTKEKLCTFITSAMILSMGPQCSHFEEKFSKKQNRKFSVFVNSGSSANLILIQALLNLGRLKKGDIVGVSALTWATNIMPLIQLGLQPFLIDCELETLNISPQTLKAAFDVQPNIKALFITNTLGHADDISGITAMCRERGILFIEDNCESMGSVVAGIHLGNWGVASTFSFFVGHHLSTIEGGMVCTDDLELYEQMVMVRAHGWDRNLGVSAQQALRKKFDVDDFYSKYTFYDLAFNVRPTEINGFLGNNQIEYWDEIVKTRYKNFCLLHEEIVKNDELIHLKYGHMDLVSSFAIPVIVKESARLSKYKKRFDNANVEFRPMIAGSMAHQPFYRKYVGTPVAQPNAEFLHRNSFYFGNNPELTAPELDLLCELLRA
jgi:CDP-4-dehydro-6-deoxyglucose reductase, E1